MELKILCAAVLFAGSAGFAQTPTPAQPSPKIYHAPRTLPLTKFYDTSLPLPAGKPGELIRSEVFDEYHLSGALSTVRILYHSRSSQGEDVAVSGVVLLPDGTPPTGGWPVIAWAHDFTGSARRCAPSLLKNLNEGPLLSMYASLGYAVVASDYAGLGTTFPHAVFDVRTNALDVIYSIPAAHAALPQLGTKWVAAGYALGAIVAVGVAETSSALSDPDFLGAVAVSGVAQPQEIFERFAQGPDYSMLVFLAQGIKTVYPEFQVREILTDKALQLYQYISESCDARLGPDVPSNDVLKSGWRENPYVKRFFIRNELGQEPAQRPLLVINGEVDAALPSAFTAKAVARLCQRKDRVLFVKYPSPNASAVLGSSVSEQASWIRARFAGLPAPGNCP